MPHDGSAIERDRRADPRDDGVDPLDGFTVVMDLRVVTDDVHVAALVIDYTNVVPALLTGLHEAARGVEISIGRENAQIHLLLPDLVF